MVRLLAYAVGRGRDRSRESRGSCAGGEVHTNGRCMLHAHLGTATKPVRGGARPAPCAIRDVGSDARRGPVRIIVTCTRCVCIYKRVNPLKNSVIDHAVNTIFARHGNTKAIQRKTAKSCNALHVIARPAIGRQTQAEAPLRLATGRLSICFGPLKPHQKVPEER